MLSPIYIDRFPTRRLYKYFIIIQILFINFINFHDLFSIFLLAFNFKQYPVHTKSIFLRVILSLWLFLIYIYQYLIRLIYKSIILLI